MAESWEVVEDLEELDEAELEALIAREEAAVRALEGAADGSHKDGERVSLEAPSPPTTATLAEATPLAAVATAAATALGTAAAAAAGAGPSTPLQADELQRQVQALEAENARYKAALVTGHNLSDLDSRKRPSAASSLDMGTALAASAARRKGLATPSTSASLEADLAAVRARLDFKQRGVDLCIVLDCTGSMSGCIEAAKSKAIDIIQLAPNVHPDAITRLAFVGYRDHCDGAGRLVVHDFVTASGGFSALQSTIGRMVAKGGGDGPEDIAGALQAVLGLSWASSTRLLVHFGDAPCHGSRYHRMLDEYPSGDPHGLVPEELLCRFCTNRIDYHFARITRHTDIMTGIFQELHLADGLQQVYTKSPGAATFDVHEYTNQASDFVPLVLKSLTSSMRRSFRSSGAVIAILGKQGGLYAAPTACTAPPPREGLPGAGHSSGSKSSGAGAGPLPMVFEKLV